MESHERIGVSGFDQNFLSSAYAAPVVISQGFETVLPKKLQTWKWLEKHANKARLDRGLAELEPREVVERMDDYGLDMNGFLEDVDQKVLARVYESLAEFDRDSDCSGPEIEIRKRGGLFSESDASQRLASELVGRREVVTPVGRIDVLTDRSIIEVKQFNSWKQGIGQLIAYSYYYPKHKKVLALFGNRLELRLLEVLVICNSQGIEVLLVSPKELFLARSNGSSTILLSVQDLSAIEL